MNKSYCVKAFKEIYSRNSGKYNLCCLAKSNNFLEEKFTTLDTTPFEFFLSDEMDDVRQKMLQGELIPSCQNCYREEKHMGWSTRTISNEWHGNLPSPKAVNNVIVNLRMFGNYCNLSCVSCSPHNSSTKTKELKDSGLESYWNIRPSPNSRTQWEKTRKDVLDHLDIISEIYLTGGEPLIIPNHWKFIMEDVPDEYAKNIKLRYDTNLTELSYRDYHITDIVKKYEEVKFSVSCDHFGEKLAFMRYPLDIEEFENNLLIVYKYIESINCTVQLLNIMDLEEIEDYYWDKFDLKTQFRNYVKAPQYMSIKHLPRKMKNELIEKWSKRESCWFVRELKEYGNEKTLERGLEYLDKLSKFRGNRCSNMNVLWSKLLMEIR